MSKTIIAVRHFGLGGRESLETAVTIVFALLVPARLLGLSHLVQGFSNWTDTVII